MRGLKTVMSVPLGERRKKAKNRTIFFCLNYPDFKIFLLIKHKKGDTPNGTHRRNDSTTES